MPDTDEEVEKMMKDGKTLSNKISGKNTAPKPTLEQRLRHSGKYQSGAPRG